MIGEGKKLAQVLRGESELQNELNNAFDCIGFSEEFIRTRLNEKSLGRNKKTTLIKDLVWGMMEFRPPDVEIIDCPIMQRLRGIKQLGVTSQIYPSAEHSRFSHSLGVAHASRRYLSEIASTETQLRVKTSTKLEHSEGEISVYRFSDDPDYDWLGDVVVHAALLHDCGHFAFSHATEAAIHDNLDHYKIGNITARRLIDLISDKISGLRNPRIAELFSVVIVLSDRFREFYQNVVLQTNSLKETDDRLSALAMLIMGRPFRSDFPGVAQIISSNEVDADKVDYVQRDSRLCNIPVGVDVARLFYRSCFLRLSGSQLRQLGQESTEPKIYFVLNASGVDTAEEMAHSRSVLFHRVYRHKTTRLLERVWSKDLFDKTTTQKGAGQVTSSMADIWSRTEESFLSAPTNPSGRKSGLHSSIRLRRIPRRVAILTQDVVRYPFHDLEVFNANVADAIRESEKEVVGGFLKSIEWDEDEFNGVQIERVEQRILELTKKIWKATQEGAVPHFESHFVPLDSTTSAELSTQITLEKSFVRHRRAENRQGQQVSAMNANKNAGYVFSESDPAIHELEPVVLLASLMALDEFFSDQSVLPPELVFKVPESEKEEDFSTLRGLPLPIIDPREICRRTGASFSDYASVAKAAMESPVLSVNCRLLWHYSEKSEQLARRFAEYNGVGNWRVTAKHVEAFISQFPVGLRDEVESMVENFTVVGRALAKDAITEFLDRLGNDTAVLPFTRTSGNNFVELVKQELYDHVSGRGTSFPSVSEAKRLAKAGKNILFFDDNVSTGFQAEAVLNKLSGLRKRDWDHRLLVEWERVSDIGKWPESLRDNVSFGFIVGSDEGVSVVKRRANAHGFGGSILSFMPPNQYTSDKPISPELKDFLSLVGSELISSDRGCTRSEARTDSLGYGNVEGLFCSLLNAPTSLITCFWHPGIFRGYPWVPLVIRRGFERRLVI